MNQIQSGCGSRPAAGGFTAGIRLPARHTPDAVVTHNTNQR
jgi:hypothetical protein